MREESPSTDSSVSTEGKTAGPCCWLSGVSLLRAK